MIFYQDFENHVSGTFYASQNTGIGTEFQGNITNNGTFNASDTGRLSVHGDWSNEGIFSPGLGTIILTRNGIQNFTGGASTDYYNITIESDADVELGSNLFVLHDLLIQANAGLDLVGYLLNVDNQFVNSGIVSQTLQVSPGSAQDFVKISNKAGTRSVYWGINLSPAADMGMTRVTIRGSPQEGCSSYSSDALILRCYTIEPQNPVNATIRFYFQGSELNGQILDQMKLWHFQSSWSQVGANYAHSETCALGQLDCWFQAEAISDYSLFGIGSGGMPTRIRILNVTSGQYGNQAFPWVWLVVLSIILGVSMKVFIQKKRI